MITLHAKHGVVELNDITIRALHKAWPTKDVDTELAKMHLWLERYPKRRPVYFWVFTRNWLRKAPDTIRPEPAGAGWWRSPEQTLQVGQGIGLPPRPGEEMADYRKRLSHAIDERRH